MKLDMAARSVLRGAILLAGVGVLVPGCGEKKAAGPVKGDPTMVVAQVGDEKILLGEVDRAVQQIYRTGARSDINPNAPEDSLQAKAVDDMVAQRLLFIEARKAGVVPTDQEAADFLKQFWQQRFPSEDSFLVALQQRGMNKDQFTHDWQMNTGITKLIEKTVQETVKVTPDQARVYYDAHPEEFQHGEILHARHILLRVPEGVSPEGSAQVKARIDAIAAQIQRGADFGQLAAANSEDTQSGARGGDLGMFGRGRMVPPFDSVAFALAPGAVSGPVRTPFGWHLIKAEEKVPAGPYPFEQIQDRLIQGLSQKRATDVITSWVEELKKKTKIKRKV